MIVIRRRTIANEKSSFIRYHICSSSVIFEWEKERTKAKSNRDPKYVFMCVIIYRIELNNKTRCQFSYYWKLPVTTVHSINYYDSSDGQWRIAGPVVIQVPQLVPLLLSLSLSLSLYVSLDLEVFHNLNKQVWACLWSRWAFLPI